MQDIISAHNLSTDVETTTWMKKCIMINLIDDRLGNLLHFEIEHPTEIPFGRIVALSSLLLDYPILTVHHTSNPSHFCNTQKFYQL